MEEPGSNNNAMMEVRSVVDLEQVESNLNAPKELVTEEETDFDHIQVTVDVNEADDFSVRMNTTREDDAGSENGNSSIAVDSEVSFKQPIDVISAQDFEALWNNPEFETYVKKRLVEERKP